MRRRRRRAVAHAGGRGDRAWRQTQLAVCCAHQPAVAAETGDPLNSAASASTAVVPLIRPGRLMGAVLVEAGRPRALDIEHNLFRPPEQKSLRFGGARQELGPLSPIQLAVALARPFRYPYPPPG